MGENLTVLNSENFDDFIKEGNVIIDFYADWCGPCKIMEPYFKEASEELEGKVKFGKIDVDANTDIAQRFEVMSIPTAIIFKNGEQVDRTVGALEKEEIVDKLNSSF